MNSFDAVVGVATVAAVTMGFNAGLLRSAVTILELRFRSSHEIAATSDANFGITGALANH